MKYEPTTKSSVEFAKNGRLEEWIHLFLNHEGDNKAFSEGLKLELRKYYAPRLMDLTLFQRCAGPEAGLKYQIPNSGFENNVKSIMEKYQNTAWDMPPLIINHTGGRYELNDGNHRYEALLRLSIHKYWVIIWETIA